MKAMILAAGRGERMRPLTDACPKPLLAAGGKPLVVWQIEALRAAGITDIVINTAWLGQRLVAALGDGGALGVRIAWSHETEALETGGGITTALPLLGDAPFIAVSGDVYAEYDYAALVARAPALIGAARDVHLVLVPNPDFHPDGDFALAAGAVDVAAAPDGRSGAAAHAAPATSAAALARRTPGQPAFTYGNIGLYHPRLFAGCAPHVRFKLLDLYLKAIDAGRAGAELFTGRWHNLGTPAQLAALDAELRAAAVRASAPAPATGASAPPGATSSAPPRAA
ncbi:nucleotidyltransferase family protein [Derxia gummosa]|uniref:Nucleotidyltransferase family protein n=1 Tax=Derxia gummosa DSM 723 TaxID=1121388 RepID=A0A8B6XBM4_9BURK|nr:nucleotidyltransferase family protein [Derxia gummosa]